MLCVWMKRKIERVRENEREISMPMTGFTEQEIVFANRMMFDVLNKKKH